MTTSEENMIRSQDPISIAWRTTFRALALAGAVTVVVTAGCSGSSSPSPSGNTDTGVDLNKDSAPPATADASPATLDASPATQDASLVPDTAKDSVVIGADLSPDGLADHFVASPDVPDASVAEVGGVDSSTMMTEVGGMDSSAPIDGSAGSCLSVAHAWSYPVLNLSAIDWDKDGTLLTGAGFYPTATTFGGKAVTNKGSSDLLVAKLDPSTGNANWVFTAGDSNDQWFGSVVSVGTSVAVLGNFTGTLDIDPVNGKIPPIINPAKTAIDFLVGLKDSDGGGVWSESVDLGGGHLVALAANPGKDYFLVCGSAENDASDIGADGSPGGGSDVVVAALKGSDGSLMWAKLFGGAMDQTCLSAALDDNGDAYFTGAYTGKLDFGSGALTPAPTDDYNSVAVPWVAKFKGADGTLLAAKTFPTTGRALPSSISIDSQGAVFLVGQIQASVTFGATTLSKTGSADAFVAKLDSSTLASVWARALGEQPGSSAGSSGVAADSTGNVTVVGRFQQTLGVGPGSVTLQANKPLVGKNAGETFVVTLDGTTGTTLCARNYGDPSSSGNQPLGISINSRASGLDKDRTAISGWFADVINFGGATTAMSSGSTIVGTKLGFLLEM
jgi:hypothetical protein